jgi:hypothetical protein
VSKPAKARPRGRGGKAKRSKQAITITEGITITKGIRTTGITIQ